MRIPSIVILGADALIAALPATPIQLAHACVLVGYQHVVPSSWGDELIAAATLRALQSHDEKPAIHCSCPFVAHRLLAVGTDLRPFLVSMLAPPVVLARYLRAVHGQTKLRITYVGRCPGAADEVVDARLTPEELLAIFADHQVVIDDQPQVFDSVIPPDRRRFRSQPGGLPTAEMLWSAAGNGGVPRALVELYGEDLPVELAQQLLTGRPVLIDVAPTLGCVCSGAMSGVIPADARACVTALEPPRATSPVIDESVITNAALPLPASPRSAIDIVAPSAHLGAHPTMPATPNEPAYGDARENGSSDISAARPEVQSGMAQPSATGRRQSPPRGVARPMSGALPTARDAEGRQLPRTYVARRRSPARVTRPTPPEAAPALSSHSEMNHSAAEPNDTAAAPVATSTAPIEEPSSPGQTSDVESTSRGEPTIRHSGSERMPGLTPAVTPLSRSTEEIFPHRPPKTDPTPWTGDVPTEPPSRFAERAVSLPVTPLSDAVRRDEPPPNAGGDRPLRQLTFYLLIAMIVLVSVTVGLLVGRSMSQH